MKATASLNHTVHASHTTQSPYLHEAFYCFWLPQAGCTCMPHKAAAPIPPPQTSPTFPLGPICMAPSIFFWLPGPASLVPQSCPPTPSTHTLHHRWCSGGTPKPHVASIGQLSTQPNTTAHLHELFHYFWLPAPACLSKLLAPPPTRTHSRHIHSHPTCMSPSIFLAACTRMPLKAAGAPLHLHTTTPPPSPSPTMHHTNR
jgi:hypothetical protein